MAKKGKKSDFLPDKTESGLLHKLYLTRKQRIGVLKWALMGAVLLVLLVLQDTLLSQVRILGAAADIVPCAMFTICIFQTPEDSCVFALIASMGYLFSGTAPGPYAMVYLTFLGFGASIFRQSYLRKGFTATLLSTAAALLVYEMAVYLTGLGLGLTRPDRVLGFLLTWAMSLLAVPLVYPIVMAIDRIGGQSWKE